MVYGYCRIISNKQKIENQANEIKSKYPNAIIIEEPYTGIVSIKKELDNLLNRLKTKDIVVFESITTMADNEAEAEELYDMLCQKGIVVEFLKEPFLNTSVYKEVEEEIRNGEVDLENITFLLRHIQMAYVWNSSVEAKNLIKKRTKEGISFARAKGKQIGGIKGKKLNIKKEGPAKDIIRKYSASFGGKLNDSDCAKEAGISRNTFYKYKREIYEELMLEK